MNRHYSKVRNIAEYRHRQKACRHCDVFLMCFPAAVADGWRHLDELNLRHRSLARGRHLILSGDPLRSLFVLRRGSLKCYELSADGDALVTGFHVPGELVGLGAIGGNAHSSCAVALEELEYCEIPVRTFRQLQETNADVRRLTDELLRRNLRIAQRQLLIIRYLDARARVAMFFLDIAVRIGGQACTGREFRLGMDRRDIADYLGLTTGTVSRTITGFEQAGLLDARGKTIRILDSKGLLSLAGPIRAPLDYAAP
ncbi:MAG: helix-turn-helix domain-containing protein [Kiloniellaceae bacterium]